MPRAFAQPRLEFRDLPKDIRDRAIEVRKACRELFPEMTVNAMQGIRVLDLDGNGSRDIVVDHERLCSGPIAGAGCSNRGCDLLIYKEGSRGQWRKIFDEHLHGKFLAIDWETMRFQLMVVSIYAGDPRCQPTPGKDYTSGQSCNLIVRYRDNRWNWEVIR
jgi:hypothetical protein